MAVTLNSDVLVVSTDDHLRPELRQATDRAGWALLECLSLRQSLKQIMKQVIATQPKVVVLTVTQMTDRSLQLIRLLQSGWRRMSVIVTTSEHSEALERQVRVAGATCYVPHNSVDVLEQYIESLQSPSSGAVVKRMSGQVSRGPAKRRSSVGGGLPIDQSMDYVDSSPIGLDGSSVSKRESNNASGPGSRRFQRAV